MTQQHYIYMQNYMCSPCVSNAHYNILIAAFASYCELAHRDLDNSVEANTCNIILVIMMIVFMTLEQSLWATFHWYNVKFTSRFILLSSLVGFISELCIYMYISDFLLLTHSHLSLSLSLSLPFQ